MIQWIRFFYRVDVIVTHHTLVKIKQKQPNPSLCSQRTSLRVDEHLFSALAMTALMRSPMRVYEESNNVVTGALYASVYTHSRLNESSRDGIEQ